ncbi:hypothetical protein AcV5_001484 [Taiwanofungus camphoratus]|nr:hypothetical protein AcV5_001484 [Antrodia cinnamomea]KAI0941070.1 hypothetical protein AcV7_002717 [Antrodia cinnamomea]
MYLDAASERSDAQRQLAQIDLASLVIARERLQHEWVSIMRAPPSPSAASCLLDELSVKQTAGDEGVAHMRCRQAWKENNAQWTTQVI